MNIFNKVTMQILKKNKTRTVVTIIGIILSTAMFTAVTTTVSSLQNYMVQNTIYNEGDWHLSAIEVDESFFDFLKNPAAYAEELEDAEARKTFAQGKVESYVYNQQLGYAYATGCTNEYKPYLYVIGADQDFCETMPVHLTGGRLPKQPNEILLPEHLAENGEVYYKVGDVLTLELGNRVSDGYVLGQYNPYMNVVEGEAAEGSDVAAQEECETLEVIETRTYTVVGFYERPAFENYSAPGYTAITTMDKVRPEQALYNFYMKLENPKDALEWYSYMSVGASYNTSLLTYLGVSEIVGFYGVLYGLAAIVCGLIMFGSVSLIYNAFSISVSERTKQFGLLSSIGATKKQLRQMVLCEALFVSAIGIPLGGIAGVGGMGITFHFIGQAFSTLTDYAVPLTLCVYPQAIIAACVIALITVLISAWIPSKRATMVTAVEAIRQSEDVKLSKREQKKLHKTGNKESAITSNTTMGEKIVYRIFGLPGMIADKYYKRSKKKYRATVISLFMSIVLFISASALTEYLTDTIENGFEKSGYDLQYHYDPITYMSTQEVENKDTSDMVSHEELFQLLKGADAVNAVSYTNNISAHIHIDETYLTEAYLDYLTQLHEKTGGAYDESKHEVFVGAVFVDDHAYEELLSRHKLDKNQFMNKEKPLGIAIDGNTFFDYNLEKYVTTDILKSKDVPIVLESENGKAELSIGAIIDERPYFVSNIYELSIVYPYSVREMVLAEYGLENRSFEYFILSEHHEQSYADIKNRIVEHGLSHHYLYDYAETVEENRTLILIIRVFAYGFIILISLIAAANVFNTISTNISLRRKDFAMLKSIGMSHKEMNRMMNFECVLYGSHALAYGIPVSIVITWLIYRVVSEGFATGFYLPWGAIGIAVGSVFLVVFATMMYAMTKIKQDNPIDALKNENY